MLSQIIGFVVTVCYILFAIPILFFAFVLIIDTIRALRKNFRDLYFELVKIYGSSEDEK
jgi:hypothetical protein